MEHAQRTTHILLGTIAIVAVIIALKFTSPVILPVLIALFLVATVRPIMHKLSKWLPESLSIVALVLLLSFVLFLATTLFLSNIQAISAKAPEYNQRLQEMSVGILKWLQLHGVQITWDQLGTQKTVSWLIRFMTSGLTSFFSLAGQLFLVLFILIFATLELQAFHTKFEIALGHRVGTELRSALTSIAERIQQYALTKTVISLGTGVATWGIALAFGIDFAAFWGLLAFLLNYIPNIGSIIAVLPPVLIAFLQFSSWKQGVGVMAGLTAVQMFIGNVIEPRMMGRSMNLSPLVVFVSMIFWGWLWGIAGMVMAVPLTVGIKIVCEHFESLQPVAVLLGDVAASKEYASGTSKILAVPASEPESASSSEETTPSEHQTDLTNSEGQHKQSQRYTLEPTAKKTQHKHKKR